MPHPHLSTSPETWGPARAAAARILRPLERFLHVQAASGLVLLATAVIGLAWANSPWALSYEHLWHTQIIFGIGPYVHNQSLHFWINEGLMTIFFFVVGLEIRREIHEGELSELKKAALPIAAALGGMVAPALLYLTLSRGPAAQQGWGVPMATDIAFAVGVLALLGNRVPPALRVLLLALAIIDDIGAIVVIALFYSGGLGWSGLAIAAVGVLMVIVLQRFGVRRSAAYVLPGAILWTGLLRAGIHPTIAGVALGLLTPARAWFGKQGFMAVTQAAVDEFREQVENDRSERELMQPLRRMAQARDEALAPVARLQVSLHPWVAFGIMPLFALANAGVNLSGIDLDEPAAASVLAGVLVGLVLGKPLGILAASFITVKLGLCALPRGVDWRGVLLVGTVAGIGFTMAIFIAGLAFAEPQLLAAAKLAVLLASVVAGVLGLLVGRLMLPADATAGAALSVSDAEASADH